MMYLSILTVTFTKYIPLTFIPSRSDVIKYQTMTITHEDVTMA